MSKPTNWTNSKDLIRAVLLLLPLWAALTEAPALQAQSVSYAAVQSTVPGTELNFPIGVAVDGGGNVFIGDFGNNRVLKVSPAGVQSTVVSGLKLPYGVAVDATGNVLVADAYNDRVLKVSPAGAQSTVGTGLHNPRGVAVDGSGNVLIADAYNNRVLKVFRSGSQTTVASGLNMPTGVAVDGAGNVFIADTDNNRVLKVAPDGTQTVVSTWLAKPNGVAVDGAGNVFIADTNDHRVVKVSLDGSLTQVGSGLYGPSGVAVGTAGSLFIADSNHNRILELQLTAVDFGPVNICPSGQSSPAPCSRTLTLNYHIGTGGTLGSPAVLTQGGSNSDFQLAGSTCTGNITGGASCTVNVTFAPQAPGARLGGVQLTDAGGKVLASTMVHGLGQGPAIAFGPGTETTVASGLNSPNGVAVDGEGNVYIADFSSHRVLKVVPDGTQTEVGSGLRFPSAVAVDGAGDVFISDTGNSRVLKVRSQGGEQTTVADGLSLPQGIAVDGAGNVFIADYGNNRVIKIAAANGAHITLGTGLKLPYGVAVDAAGNVFIADYNNDRVVKVSPLGVQTQVAGGLNLPTGVAVDAAGTVFIADQNNQRVLEVPANGAPPTPVGTGLARPQAVAVDATGNLFIADTGNQRVVELQRSRPPALDFSLTLVGKTNGPQTVTIRNIGNQRLNSMAPGFTVGANFQQSFGGLDCKSGITLTPGANCNLSINFVPETAGNLQSTVVLTDNALNAAPVTQTISLSGTSQLPTTTAVQSASGVYSDPVTLTAVVGPSGLSFAGSLQFRLGGTPACSVAVTGSGTYSCTYNITEAASNYTIYADLTSSDSSVQGSSGFNKLAVTTEDATIVPSTLNPASVTVNTTGKTGPFSLKATVRQAADDSPGDLSKADSFSVKLVAGSTAIACPAGVNIAGQLTATCRVVPVGTYTVQWSTTGRYYQAPTVTSALTVTP